MKLYTFYIKGSFQAEAETQEVAEASMNYYLRSLDDLDIEEVEEEEISCDGSDTMEESEGKV